MKNAIISFILISGIIVTAVPATASALSIGTTMKFPEVQKDGTTRYTLKDIGLASDTRDNATTLINGIGYGIPTITVYHNGSVSGKFFLQYVRPDGSKYSMPVSIYLEARRDYQHAIIKDRNTVELVGTGSVNGHTGKITGSALLWVYRPAIPAAEIGLVVGEIPEW